MTLRLYNTLTRQVEEFSPPPPYEVKMYNCGPTVYNYAQIGNFRTFIMGDILRRSFEFLGYHVNQVMNITDVDDKTIKRSQTEEVPLQVLTRKYEEIFFHDLDSLNILKPKKTPRATENIEAMIAMITLLLQKGLAYQSADGVYFDITKSKNYGALAGLNLVLISKSRIANDEYDKENAHDFALWKFHTDEDGEVEFEAPFGKGRPGWHIECSAMSKTELGDTLDIHTGGTDLIFPHHTNEIAQSEGANNVPFARFWIHGAFLTVDGKKMSKSLGNFTTLETLKEHGILPIAFRYFTLSAHYRSLLNFTWDALGGAEEALSKLRRHVHAFGETMGTPDDEYLSRFGEAIANDLNMPQALAILWELIKDPSIADTDKRATAAKMDNVFGLKLFDYIPNEVVVTPKLEKLLDDRKVARDTKNFAESDRIRNEIKKLGYEVKDALDGQQLEKI